MKHLEMALFSENDILYVTDAFFACGFHDFSVADSAVGRAIVATFLGSTHCFSTVGCLTISEEILDAPAINIYHDFVLYGVFDSIVLADMYYALDSFILERFYYDFVWIEETPELINSIWFKYFKRKLFQFAISFELPIITYNYTQ
jgi:hypothetical protein